MPVTEYTWDPVTDSILEETDGIGNVLASYTNEPSPYGPLISQRSGGATRYFHFDALDTTRELTDDAEDITDTLTYDAWGNELVRTGATETAFGWTGRLGYHTSQSHSLTTVRNRIYNSSQGLWSSVDALFPTNSRAKYLYCMNTPIARIDPSGLLDCAGAPSGVVHIDKRGQFTLFSFDRFPDDTIFDAIGTRFEISWRWYEDPNRFLGRATDGRCCCCEKIGFAQIGRFITVYAYSLIGAYDSGWFVDGFPYNQAGSIATATPCMGGDSLILLDSPNAPKWRNLTRYGISAKRLLFFYHEFETCAYCLEGDEGVVWRSGHRHKSPEGVTVYGCVRFDFLVRWRADLQEYEYFKTLADPVVGPLRRQTTRSVGNRGWFSVQYFAGVKQSANFEDVILNSGFPYNQ